MNSFGTFGSPSGFNSNTNIFSSSNNANQNTLRPGGLFGATSSTAPALGASSAQSSGLFSAASPFSFTSNPQTGVGVGVTQQSTGTGIAKFNAPPGTDQITKSGVSTTINTLHQCITAMKEYEGKSLEELRLEDYQANRKFPQSSSTGGFGTTVFSQSSNTNSGFGGQTNSLFGSNSNNKPLLFGSSTSSTTTPATGGGIFGSTPQNQVNRSFFGGTTSAPTVGTFSGFGAQAPTTNTFGTNQVSQPSLFSGLGTNTGSGTTTSGGIFGSNPSTTGTSGSLFSGATTNKPVFSGFGSGATSTSTQQSFSFGQAGTTTTTSSTPSLFGQSTSATQSPLTNRGTFGGFGSQTATTTAPTTGFNAPATTTATTQPSLFGSSTNRTSFGGGLGTGTSTTTSGFGGFGTGTSTNTTPNSNIFGGFGQTTAQPATISSTTASPFGNLNTGAGLGTSSFGSGTTGGGLFGSTTPATQQNTTNTSGGLFGNQQSNTGVQSVSTFGTGFGQTNISQPSLFGSTSTNTNTPATGGLFGSTNTNQQNSQFSLNSGATNNTGGIGTLGSFSLSGATNLQSSNFGLNLNNTLQSNPLSQQSNQPQSLQQIQQAQQQQLQQQQFLSLSNSPYGTSTSSLLKNTLQDLSKREDILKPLSPIAQRQYIVEATSPPKVTTISAPVSASSSLTSEFKGGLSQPLKITPKVLTSISTNRSSTGAVVSSSSGLFEGLEEEETPCFYPRRNVKKLLFRPSNEHNASRRASGNGSINGDILKKPIYSSNDESLKFGSNLSGNAGQGLNDNLMTGPVPNPSAYGSSFMANSNIATQEISDEAINNQVLGGGDNQSEVSTTSSSSIIGQHPAGIVLERPGYFTIPSIQDLVSIYDPKTNECLVENFSIGRVDYGCITFPGITNVCGMNLDELVHIRRKEVHVYPDDNRKPPVGQGLNKPAEITLHRIWPLDKQTKLPVTEPNRVIELGYNKKIERATIEMGATFIDYDPVTGSWTFKVKHFSKYGLSDSEEESDDLYQSAGRFNPTNLNPLSSSGIPTGRGKKLLDIPTSAKSALSEGAMDNKTNRHEKEMIEKQLKLIETRRLELMKQNRKITVGVGSNTISNNHWDQLISEYNIPLIGKSNGSSDFNKTASVERSQIHLELSEESETNESDDLNDNESMIAPNSNQIRKALVLDNEADDTVTDFNDENKENKSKLYPSLNGLKIKNSDRLYSGHLKINSADRDTQELAMNFEEDGESSKIIRNEGIQYQGKSIDQLTFLAANDRLLTNFQDNQKFTEMFFNENENNINSHNYGVKYETDQAKYTGFNQKPITMGLLKRGIGAISILNSDNKLMDQGANKFSSSLKGDQFHGEPKVSKFSAYSFNLVNIKRISGPVILKPKLWNRSIIHNQLKTFKPSDRTSKSGFIQLSDSLSNNLFYCVADAGLYNSYRFRPCWTLNPNGGYGFSRLGSNQQFANVLQFNTIHSIYSPERVKTIRENCECYLFAQLELTESISSKLGLPLLRPKKGNSLIKKCFQITQQIRNNIGDHPDADNVNHTKMVWSLCQNLWGDIPESLRTKKMSEDNISEYESEQIRKRLLGDWLSEVSSQRVEKECKYIKYSKNKDSYLGSIFSLLTANRLLDACNLAIENMDFRLALLISQSSGSNDDVRTTIRKQLKEWSTSRASKFISNERLKLYVLIAGDLEYNKIANNQSQLINVCENLDWKRQFGLNLWYQSLPINSINDALIEYEKCAKSGISNKPVPPYIEDSLPATQLSENQSWSSRESRFDTCFHLIKLYCDNNYSFEDVISPLSHTGNQLDFRLSWHLAMALISVRYNHVQQSCLDTLHDSFAEQLQALGLWHWAIYVLMHVENNYRRESSVKMYLAKHVSSQSNLNEQEKFVVEKLGVPVEWVYEQKAFRAKFEQSNENQLKLLLKAHKWNEAHLVLIESIAPDLFLKHNFKMLNEYLCMLSKEKESISKWNIGGQIYLDYFRLNQRAEFFFNLPSDEEQKVLKEDMYNEINNEIMNLSSRIKEFNVKTPKKLLCSLQIIKLLLKFFIAFYELNKSSDEITLNIENETDDNVDFIDTSKDKLICRSLIDKAIQQTELVPDQNLYTIMLLKKTQYTREFLMVRNKN